MTRNSQTARLLLSSALLLAGTLGLSNHARAGELTNRRLERPASQSGAASTTSFVDRAVNLPAAGSLEFDYYVDSEADNDRFELQVDGVVQFQASGRARGGRSRIALGAGSHVLRFAYVKNGAIDSGRDTAWIDRIIITAGTEVLETHSFGEAPLGAAAGFNGGGSGGGWSVTARPRERALKRPIEGAFTGYQPAHTVSSIQRTFTWPAGSQKNAVLLSYAVDSEENGDFLRVYVDGVEKFAISGANRSGRQRIDVGGPGEHLIELAYDKDESVDVGTDDARILALQAVSESSDVEFGGFEYAELGESPDGWSTGAHATSGLTWQVGHPLAPRVYAKVATGVPMPAIDGVISNDVASFSRVKLPNFLAHGAKGGELLLETVADTGWLFALRVPRGSNGAASLDLMFDLNPAATAAGSACSSGGTLPDPDDRRIQLEFPPALGGATVTQQRGTCSAGSTWTDVSSGDEWTVQAVASEPTEDEGFIHVELSVAPSSPATLGAELGLGLTWTSPGVALHLPRIEGAAPNPDDAASWESVRYSTQAELRSPNGVIVDGRPVRGAGE